MRNAIDHLRKAQRDAAHPCSRQMREARDARAGVLLEVLSHRTEHACAREETMNQNHDVFARMNLGENGGEVTR